MCLRCPPLDWKRVCSYFSNIPHWDGPELSSLRLFNEYLLSNLNTSWEISRMPIITLISEIHLYTWPHTTYTRKQTCTINKWLSDSYLLVCITKPDGHLSLNSWKVIFSTLIIFPAWEHSFRIRLKVGSHKNCIQNRHLKDSIKIVISKYIYGLKI